MNGLTDRREGMNMGGSSRTTSGTTFDPEMLAKYKEILNQYQGKFAGPEGYDAAAKAAAQNIQTQGFGAQFNAAPDAITKGLAAQATQGMGQQAAAQKAAIAKQFQAQPGAGGILQRQIDMKTRLNANPSLFQAFQQQGQREQMQNQGRIQGLEAGNASVLKQLGARGAPLDAMKGLLGSTGQALEATGTKYEDK